MIARIDWDLRYKRMRAHTALHLLSVVLPYPVTGGSVGDAEGRLDFDSGEAVLDKAEVERDREMNARSLAYTEYLAREIAGIRLALEHKPDRDDVTEAIERLTRTIEQTYAAAAPLYAGGSPGEDELQEREAE